MTPEKITFPITFEKGLFEHQEESVLDTGYLTVLENWIPEPSGALRARRRWQSGSQAGSLPAIRKTRGIGRLATQDPYATPAPRQTKQQQGGDVTSLGAAWSQATADQSLLLAAVQAKHRAKRRQYVVGTIASGTGIDPQAFASATWSQTTQSGSLLLAFVMAGCTGGGALLAGFTPPAGWTERDVRFFNWGSGWSGNGHAVYEIQNAGARSGAEQFVVDAAGVAGTSVYGQVILVEVTGIATASAFDVLAQSNGQTATGTPTTGTTGAPTQTDTFAVACIMTDDQNQSSPTNGFTQVAAGGGIFCHGLYQKAKEIQTADGVSVSPNDRWGGVVVIYKTATNLPTITAPGGWTLLNQGTLGNQRTALYHIFPASTRSGTETFTFSQNSRAEILLVEYTGITSRDTGIDAVATGTSTAPSVTDATATSPAAGQKVLVLGLLGSGQVSHVGHGAGFGVVVGTDLVLHAKMETGVAAQTFSATLNTSAPWIAILEAYESSALSTTGGYFLAAHDDGANFDIWAIADLMSGTWSSIDANLVAADRTIPVAFADGLANILYTHPDFAATRRWDGSAAAAVAAAPRGRTICFYRNRFFIGGTKSGAFGSNAQTSNVTRLWYSNLGSYTTWGNNDYIDVNQDDGEPIEDIAPVGTGLLIAKRSSLWFLSGTGPDNFQLDELEAGDGYPGRSICVGEHGAVIAGKHHLWMWDGGRPHHMSTPVDGTYEIGGNFVTTGCVGPLIWICDPGSGVMWVHDHINDTWWIETHVDQPACVFTHEEMVLYGPLDSIETGLLAFRMEPGSPRARDVMFSTIYKAETPELYPGGVGRGVTPRHLYLELRQRGGDNTDAGLVVTPIYDGVEQTPITVVPQADAKPFTKRLDIGSRAGVKGVKLRFEQENMMTDDAVMDIERAEFIGLVSPHR
jgi:hypothetical protein